MPSRELYRNTVAEFAEHSDCSELEIAQLAIRIGARAQKHRRPIRDWLAPHRMLAIT